MPSSLESDAIRSLSEQLFLKEPWPPDPCLLTERTTIDATMDDVREVLGDADAGPAVKAIRIHRASKSLGYSPLQVNRLGMLPIKCDYTYSVDTVDTYCPQIKNLAKRASEVTSVPAHRVSATLFISPPGTGVPWHFDASEVFVITLHGKRIWRVAENTDVLFPTQHYAAGAPLSADLRLLGCEHIDAPQSYVTIELCEGQALFLPRGVWHSTHSQFSTVSLSLAVATPTPLELLLDGVRRALMSESDWRNPLKAARLTERTIYEASARISQLAQQDGGIG